MRFLPRRPKTLLLNVVLGGALLAGLSSPARAAEPLWQARYGLQDTRGQLVEGLTIQFTALPRTLQGEEVVAVTGLPYPGEVLWDAKRQILAYRHPAEFSWLEVAATDLPASPLITTATAAATTTPWQGHEVRRWAMTRGGATCGALFGSPGLTAQTGLMISDVQTVLALLEWLNTGRRAEACPGAVLAPAVAARIGFPTRYDAGFGTLVLQDLVTVSHENLELSVWPNVTYPADGEARLRLLLVQFALPDRAAFLRQYGNLPMERQIEAASQLLLAELTAP